LKRCRAKESTSDVWSIRLEGGCLFPIGVKQPIVTGSIPHIFESGMKGHEPFFLVKNSPFQSYSLESNTSIDVKTGSPDPADFATTRLLNHWPIGCLRHANGRPTIKRTARAAENRRGVLAVCATVCDHWHTAAVTEQYANGLCPICHSRVRLMGAF
jgi:hypothetical protein